MAVSGAAAVQWRQRTKTWFLFSFFSRLKLVGRFTLIDCPYLPLSPSPCCPLSYLEGGGKWLATAITRFMWNYRKSSSRNTIPPFSLSAKNCFYSPHTLAHTCTHLHALAQSHPDMFANTPRRTHICTHEDKTVVCSLTQCLETTSTATTMTTPTTTTNQ